ncbi:MAG: hypothetical protein J0H59_20605 [Comamonadaceae bacterium]|nr:hypothetical protein [Comamonadaceae bacterium]
MLIPRYICPVVLRKARAFIIPLFTDNKRYAAIPLPLGLHVLPNTGRVLTELVIGDHKDAGKRVFDAAGEIAGALNPLGGGNVFTMDGLLRTVAPTVADLCAHRRRYAARRPSGVCRKTPPALPALQPRRQVHREHRRRCHQIAYWRGNSPGRPTSKPHWSPSARPCRRPGRSRS